MCHTAIVRASPTNAPTGVRWAPGGECLAATPLASGGPASTGNAAVAWHTVGVRLTEFWARMEQVLGTGYYSSWSQDHVLDELGGAVLPGEVSQFLDGMFGPEDRAPLPEQSAKLTGSFSAASES